MMFLYQGVRMCSRMLPGTASAADHVISHICNVLKPKTENLDSLKGKNRGVSMAPRSD